ncbi:MAG: hypothetical protein PVF74_02800, partial [Anaerolineales bacterium]
MKNFFLGLTVALIAISAVTVGVSAASEQTTPSYGGPFNGKFQGSVYGDQGSRAPLILNMTQYGDEVRGTATLGQGLYVDGGWCGKANIPAISQGGVFNTLSSDPNRVLFNTAFNVQGFRIGVNLDGKVTANGETLNAD